MSSVYQVTEMEKDVPCKGIVWKYNIEVWNSVRRSWRSQERAGCFWAVKWEERSKKDRNWSMDGPACWVKGLGLPPRGPGKPMKGFQQKNNMIRCFKKYFKNKDQYHGLWWDKDGGRETARILQEYSDMMRYKTKVLAQRLEGKRQMWKIWKGSKQN